MKKFFTVLMAIIMSFACLSMAACQDNDNGKETLYVYTNAGFAPYEYLTVDGKVVGVDIEIMEEIAEILNYNIVIKDIKFEQILEEVQRNKFAVGAAGMTKNDERDAIALSSISYATSVQYVIAPAGTFSGTVSLEQLAGKKIGTQNGTTGYYMVSDAIDGTTDDDGNHVVGELEGTNATVIKYQNAILASNDIGSRVDCVVIDKLPAESIAQSNSSLECYPIDAEPESYVIYFNKQATELVEKVNQVLQVLIDEGVVNYLTLKHSGGII